MKKFSLILTCCLLVALCSLQANAQQKTRFGLGLGISSAGMSSDLIESMISPTSIYLPITGSGFRFEPEIGFFRYSSKSDNDDEDTASLFQIGTGLFAVKSVNSTNLYYGARVGVTLQSTSSKVFGNTYDSSTTNFFVGPATGAEYLFGDNFSLGGEAQLLYTSFGKDEDTDPSASFVRTRVIFFVRWHL